jgi:hypothetical protein
MKCEIYHTIRIVKKSRGKIEKVIIDTLRAYT